MIKAVVFDLDDTLAAEKQYVKSGYRAVAEYLSDERPEHFSDAKITESRLWELFKGNAQNVFNRLFEEYGISYEKEDILELVRLYREHDIFTELYGMYTDAEAAIDFLRSKSIKLGILSDGFLVSQQKKVRALGLEKCFDAIILTDEYGSEYRKPSRLGFEKMAELLGVEPAEMAYIGDNPKKDFAVKAQLPVLAVRIYREGSVYENAAYMNDIHEDIAISGLGESELLKITGE